MINFKKLAVSIGKAVAPVAKAALPAVAVAVLAHQPLKKVLVEAAKNAARDELAKRL